MKTGKIAKDGEKKSLTRAGIGKNEARHLNLGRKNGLEKVPEKMPG